MAGSPRRSLPWAWHWPAPTPWVWREHQQTLDYLVDLITDVQTVRSCLTAGELDPQVTQAGYVFPGLVHMAAGSIAMLKARQRITEILRMLPGSSLMMAPADTDLAAPELAAGLEESFGGGGYTALQRSALLNLAWDHISSGLDGRESAFELHANGGIPTWRNRLRRWFRDYNELANGVLKTLDLDMPMDRPERPAPDVPDPSAAGEPTVAKGYDGCLRSSAHFSHDYVTMGHEFEPSYG